VILHAATTVTLPAIASDQVIGFILVLGRVGGLFVLAPVFSSRMLPMRIKAMIAFAVSLAMMPMATHGVAIPQDAGSIATLLMKEVAVGLVFAFPMALLMGAVQAGASLLDTVIGFSFAAVLDPLQNQQSAILGQFYSLFATMVFALSGGDRIMLEGLGASYRALPLTAMPSTAAIAAGGVAAFAQVFTIGLAIVAPVLVALVITDAALGLISRAVPQMNVFFVGMPAKILIGFGIIAASLPFVAGQLQTQLEQSVLQAVRIVGG
jgi:flagellar biosynthetic protein FliR